MYVRDWRKALRSPPTYRIGNRTLRFQFHFAWILLCLGSLVLVFFVVRPASKSSYSGNWLLSGNGAAPAALGSLASLPSASVTAASAYNYTYPLSTPIVLGGIRTFRIGVIADLDTDSKSTNLANTWRSYYKKGYLSYGSGSGSVTVKWDSEKPIELTSSYSLKGRGMELSEIVTFNGKLLTFDDRTGFTYEIVGDKVVPWLFLSDGNGHAMKGFKSEWATVKDQVLFVGSMGKEWTTGEGEFENFDPMYVKTINTNGEIHHHNWIENYKSIRAAIGISWPGYMIHESGVWSSEARRWYFLPRRCSKERYNDTKDEHMGCNKLFTVNDDFSAIKTTDIGVLEPTHGYSSFKFLPGTDDKVIVALQTVELGGKTSTYITAFHVDGKIMLSPELVSSDVKYEGFEFI